MARSVARRMGVAAVIVSMGVFLARILGFVREMVFAYVLGADGASDEYFVAFIIPDFVNYLLAGGYLSITFIPIFSRHLVEGNEQEAWRAFAAVGKPLVTAVTALVLLAMALAEPIIDIAVPGFTPEQVARAAYLTRIVLPAQTFFIAGTLLMAVQYAKERFTVPTLAGVLYNVGIIAGGVLLGALAGLEVEGFAWGVLAGAFIGNFLVQVYGARKVGLRLPGQSGLKHPAVREYLALAIPLMVAQSVVALDESFVRVFGSLIDDGAISHLNYARRIMLVPVGLLGQAAGVAAYPFLAALAAEGKTDELAENVSRPLRYVVLLSLGATAWLMSLAQPIVTLLFERGRFDAADSEATASALVLYSLAIPIWGVQQIIARGFYARRQMWTVVLIGSAATVIALPVYYFGTLEYGIRGLAAASVCALAVYATVLAFVWYRRTGVRHLFGVLKSVARALPAAALAGLASYGVGIYVGPQLPSGYLGLAMLIVLAGFAFLLVWIGVLSVFKSRELSAVFARVRRRS